MKKGMLLAAVIFLVAAGFAQAQEGQLSGSLDVTFMSSYIWRGFDMYGESRTGIQPSVNLDLYGTGFGVNILMSRANESGRENLEEMRYTIHYGNSLFEGETYTTNYTVGYTYFSYPDMPTKAINMQELFATLSCPEICTAGIVPSYTVVWSWPAEGNSTMANKSGGYLHILGLGYDMTVGDIVPELADQVLHLSAATVYNDGAWDFASPGGNGTVDHDWSHIILGVSTDFDLANDVSLTPAVYYQVSIDDSVNTEDEVWCTLGLSYKF